MSVRFVSPIAVSMTSWIGAHADAVARRRLAVHPDVEVGRAGDLLRIDVGGARDAGGATSATARARSSRTLRSLPKTFTPTSERIPVVSMLMRLMIGWVQMFATPGRAVACVQLADQLLARHARPPLRLAASG